MEIILIAAMAQNRVIGLNNSIPWHIPEEMQFFKKSTIGHAVIMGRKTYESIGAPLTKRLNVVLSRNSDFHAPGCTVAMDLTEGIKHCGSHNKIFIIGGESIYKEAIKIADTILLSVLENEYEGDVFFPHISTEHFREVSIKPMGKKSIFTLYTYQRK